MINFLLFCLVIGVVGVLVLHSMEKYWERKDNADPEFKKWMEDDEDNFSL